MIGGMSDTTTRYGNTPHYCGRCSQKIWECICHKNFILFLDAKFDEEQIKLIPKKIIAHTHNIKPSIIILRKNLHSISGMKGLKLLKRIDKNGPKKRKTNKL